MLGASGAARRLIAGSTKATGPLVGGQAARSRGPPRWGALASTRMHGRRVYGQAGPRERDAAAPREPGGEPGGAPAAAPRPQSIAPPGTKATLRHLRAKYEAGLPLAIVTAYDYPSAQLAERAGVDVVLVGDSVGMVVLGYDSTTPVTMDEMIHHTKAARRGAPHSLLVADLPFGSYLHAHDCVHNGARLLKEGGADAVKLEGGRRVLAQVRALVDAGIAVMGHVGLTPQTHASLGGYTVQGKTTVAARELLADARALEAAGCFSIVLEMVPHKLAALVTAQLRVPTIGIGAGVSTSGQVQVMHDLLGLYDKFQPKFAARYAAVGAISGRALAEYVADVAARRFPGAQHSFAMPDAELHALEDELAVGAVDSDGERRGDLEARAEP
ncbi:hypothetical protein KFE25_001896 [Diacronema lutheri]|uniref:3-methyl-2-oxobutanoate hydroxymethyltransferase n=1 Tax=Diacronema lutheri TaxID=2081491 RepID=A0A8J5XQQ7_DIALT|nr:hypothetical protein KFE25_001896 [Diacronema lutheri]